MTSLPTALFFVAALAASVAAQAQLRTIPQQAERGWVAADGSGVRGADGRPLRLAPGAQIRDTHNRIVLPQSLPPGAALRYVVDGQGELIRAWIPTPQEMGQ